MTDTPASPPASVLAAAREAVELAGDDLALVEPYVAFHLHASKHYGAIAAALLAAQEREAELRAEVEALREYKAMYLGLCK